MSQQDFDITTADANTGATMRVAINTALQALASNSAGPTAPSVPYAYQWWADSTDGVLKQRNGANTAWTNIINLSTGLPYGLNNVSNTADNTKSVLSATKLATPRAINGVSFDGSADITIADGTKEAALGNPAVNGYVLASTIAGVRSWVVPATGGGGSSTWGGIIGTLADQTDLVSALNAKAPTASPTFTGTVSGITKSMVGLGNVDNTSDAGKPVSTAQQTALNLKADTTALAAKAALATAQSFTKAQRGTVVNLTSTSTSIAVDLSLANHYKHALTESTTLAAPTNAVEGQSGTIELIQNASTAKTLAYNTFWKFIGGAVPSLTTALSAKDTFVYTVAPGGTYATCRLLGDIK